MSGLIEWSGLQDGRCKEILSVSIVEVMQLWGIVAVRHDDGWWGLGDIVC